MVGVSSKLFVWRMTIFHYTSLHFHVGSPKVNQLEEAPSEEAATESPSTSLVQAED